MSIQFIDRRVTVNVQPTSNGYSFEYGGKIHKSRTEKGVHNFFLEEYSSNRLDTVKLRFNDKKYYLHFTLDEPEKFSTKRALRSILAQENGGAWIEEKNGKQRYFVEKGWVFSNVREVSEDDFMNFKPLDLIQKISRFVVGALSLASTTSLVFSKNSLRYGFGKSIFGLSLLQTGFTQAPMSALGEFRVTPYGTKWNPAITSLSNGGFVVAWQTPKSSSAGTFPTLFKWGIDGQIYNASGIPLTSENFPLENSYWVVANHWCPALAGLKDADFVVAWLSDEIGIDHVYGLRWNSSGIPLESQFQYNNKTIERQSCPAITKLSDGGFVIALAKNETGDWDIYGQKFNTLGMPVGPEFRINTNTTSDQSSPALAGLKGGGFVAVWHGLQTGDADIYGQRYDASMAPVGSEFRINTRTTYNQWDPTIAELADGGFVIVWRDQGIYARIYDLFARPSGQQFVVNAINRGFKNNPSISSLKHGGFVVVWDSDQNGDRDIYCRMYNSSRWMSNEEFRVNTNTTREQKMPAVSALEDGGFVVVWEGNQAGAISGANAVYAQRYIADREPVFYPSLSSSTSSDSKTTQTKPTENSVSNSIFSPPLLTTIAYGTLYPIHLNGVIVGNFIITGGTGLIDPDRSNVLTIQIDPAADLAGGTIVLFFTKGYKGNFQSIDITGTSCLTYEFFLKDFDDKIFQIHFSESSCALALEIEPKLFPMFDI